MPILNILVAYPYCTEQLLNSLKVKDIEIRFLLDCGAFTAFFAGKKIELDDYCKFVETCEPKPWRYFSLDVIGNPDKTAKNFEIMLERGFKPVPIYTPGEDKQAIDYFYSKSDVVGFGGINNFDGKKRRGYIKGIMNYAKGRKVHLLGFTNIDYIKAYKPYMCDSSSWESGARYGTLRLYVGKGKFMTISKKEFANKPSTKVLNAIRRLGIDPYIMRNKESWHGGNSYSRTLCAASGVDMSVDIEKNIDTKLFLASATPLAVDLLVNGFKQLYGGKK